MYMRELAAGWRHQVEELLNDTSKAAKMAAPTNVMDALADIKKEFDVFKLDTKNALAEVKRHAKNSSQCMEKIENQLEDGFKDQKDYSDSLKNKLLRNTQQTLDHVKQNSAGGSGYELDDTLPKRIRKLSETVDALQEKSDTMMKSIVNFADSEETGKDKLNGLRRYVDRAAKQMETIDDMSHNLAGAKKVLQNLVSQNMQELTGPTGLPGGLRELQSQTETLKSTLQSFQSLQERWKGLVDQQDNMTQMSFEVQGALKKVCPKMAQLDEALQQSDTYKFSNSVQRLCRDATEMLDKITGKGFIDEIPRQVKGFIDEIPKQVTDKVVEQLTQKVQDSLAQLVSDEFKREVAAVKDTFRDVTDAVSKTKAEIEATALKSESMITDFARKAKQFLDTISQLQENVLSPLEKVSSDLKEKIDQVMTMVSRVKNIGFAGVATSALTLVGGISSVLGIAGATSTSE
eukprot:TRINITY_DN5920_c0_g1_i1.p1 TRINITY_DN5920_c0_g1~~TRINITY_DN5920_c0_g1_i1.p1  ORF type:complete len:529 (-),score=113.20 TRINITY_DN5920_c0_g1_i1:282-1664(-)